MTILSLVKGTARELSAKATLYVLAGISTLIILGVAFSISSTTSPEGRSIVLFGNPTPAAAESVLAEFAGKLEAGFAGGLFFGVVVFGVFATAGVMPDALEKGTVDLYLSKPIARWQLLVGKYLGCVVVIFINIAYFIGALWLIFGLKIGIWDVHFLLGGLLLSFVFACLHAIVTFFGTATRNVAIAIIAGALYLMVIAGLLQNREHTFYLISDNSIYRGILDGLYYLFPQIPAMQDGALHIIAGEPVAWTPFLQSFLSSSALIVGAGFVLQKKDF